jgi:hypothetical protein
MNFTDEDRKVAQELCKSPTTLAFLEKLFTPDEEPAEKELAKNVAALDDAEYGRMMKALYLMRTSFQLKLDQLKALGREPKGKAGPRAPR